jgi:hypothetical protein
VTGYHRRIGFGSPAPRPLDETQWPLRCIRGRRRPLGLSPYKRYPSLVAAIEVARVNAEFAQQCSRGVSSLTNFAVDDNGSRAERVKVVTERVDG